MEFFQKLFTKRVTEKIVPTKELTEGFIAGRYIDGVKVETILVEVEKIQNGLVELKIVYQDKDGARLVWLNLPPMHQKETCAIMDGLDLSIELRTV